jgi:hypothetical protein
VRDYPTEGKGARGSSSPWGGKWWHDGAKMVRAAAVRSPGVERLRRERKGCTHVAGEGEKMGGEEKGVRQRCGALLSRRDGRGGGWSAGGATWRRGVGRGVGASAVVGRHGVAGSGPAAMLMGGVRAGGVRLALKQGRRGTSRWGPAQ